jgi:hypothetical protein
MSRTLAYAIGLAALILAVAGLAVGSAAAGAQATTGEITGQVTDTHGMPLAGITVAAAPVHSPDAITLASTDANGAYVLPLPPGDYEVAFNTLEPVNDGYGGATFGGPGPGPETTCTVCGGRPVTVTAGGTTPGIGAALASPPFSQTGFVRPLSGGPIRVLGGRLTFRMGCHVEPTGCIGTARLRLGHLIAGRVIASVKFVVLPGTVGQLVFRVPTSVIGRLRLARHRELAALVEITAPPAHTITRFELAQR